MVVLFKTSVAAALSLILGLGVISSYATPVTVAAAKSSLPGTLQVSPNAGMNLHITDYQDPFASSVNDDPAPLTTVKYFGTQLSGVVLTWNDQPITSDMLAPPATSQTTIRTENSTVYPPPYTTVNEVRAPLAAWQSITGLLVVMLITTLRPPKPAAD